MVSNYIFIKLNFRILYCLLKQNKISGGVNRPRYHPKPLLLVKAAQFGDCVDVDVFGLGVVIQDHLVRLATDARFFVAAKRRARMDLVVGIDPHATRLKQACDRERLCDIARKYGAA